MAFEGRTNATTRHSKCAAFEPRVVGRGTGEMICSLFWNLIRTRICDEYSGSMKIATQLDHVSHCETAFVTNCLNDGPIEYLS